jgi:hypothetical protein
LALIYNFIVFQAQGAVSCWAEVVAVIAIKLCGLESECRTSTRADQFNDYVLTCFETD